MSLLADDLEARRVIREELAESLIVEAAAGTGKTSELVQRAVRVLAAGRGRVEGLVLVTFTQKAAGELKLRLRQELDRAKLAAIDPAERGRLEQAIAHLEEARIGTIHGFCASLLKERPVEARVDPRFDELTEDAAREAWDTAFARWLEQSLAVMPESLSRALARKDASRSRRTPTERLRHAGQVLAEWRSFAAPWRALPLSAGGDEVPFDRAAEVNRLFDQAETLALFAASAANPKDPLARGLSPAVQFVRFHEHTRRYRALDADALEAGLITLARELERKRRLLKGGGGTFSPRVTRDEVLALRDHFLDEARAFERRANASLAAELQRDLFEVIAAFEAAKARVGRLDFTDLLVFTRDLLRDDAVVRAHLQSRIEHLFIDEFQDTDPLQVELLLLLAADDPAVSDWRKARPRPGKLFVVGDPKQSIYRFRRADIVLYQAVKSRLLEQGVRLVHLSRSFRATAPLQEGLNAAFSRAMLEDAVTGQPGYVPLAGGPGEEEARPSLVALPVPRPFQDERATKQAAERGLPAAAAAFVRWLVRESGWTVREGASRVPVATRHVALLFRRYTSFGRDLTRPYVEALEARGLKHILVSGRAFHDREEVEVLRAALTAVEWPDDELAVYATLRGPLFAIADEVLFRYREEHGRLLPHRPAPATADPDFFAVSSALYTLGELHRRRNRRPIVETVQRLLAATRASAGFALRPSGSQVLANVQRVIDLARSYEMQGGLSFRGLVLRLDRESEEERSLEAPLLEEGADGVRLMTVHAAKGLEFPVVILADLTTAAAWREPDSYFDAERGLYATKILDCAPYELLDNAERETRREGAEATRLAYVAATRARDLLVVPALPFDPRPSWAGESWFAPLFPAIDPAPGHHHAEAAPGCPPMSGSALLQPVPRDGLSYRPYPAGQVRPAASPTPAVWWDPKRLELAAQSKLGLEEQRERLLEPRPGAAEEGMERYRRFAAERAAVIERARARSLAPFSPSEPAAPEPPSALFPIQELKLPRREDRPAGTRFGSLVHAVLEHAHFDAGRAELTRWCALEGRILGASPSEIGAALAPVEAWLGSELARRAAASPEVYRELPVVYRTAEGALLDGTIDLCFREGERMIVVDYKTDQDPELNRARYLAQMRWYLAAVSALFGAPARGFLVTV